MISLFNGDCLEILREIDDESVDLILTDPPYGVTPCSWDKVIDFNLLWPHLKRIIKKNGVICIFGTEPFSSNLRLSCIENYKYDWYWEKCKSLGANFCHAKNSPIRTVESISVFSLGKINHVGKTINRMNYNPQDLKECSIKSGHKHGKVSSFRKYIERPSHKKYIRNKTRYPSSVLRFNFEKQERKNRFHPKQKPLSILEYLIKTYTKEYDTVLDFAMGSGSTGVAAKKNNRSFIGIEIDKDFFEVSKNRINY